MSFATTWMDLEGLMERHMPGDFTYMWNLKITRDKQNRNRHRYREHFDDCQMGEELGRWVKKMNGVRSTN